MLGRLPRFIILLIVFHFSLSLRCSAQTAIDSLKNKLATAESLQDSITLLYNIYDVSSGPQQGRALESLYSLTKRRGDFLTVNDVLKLSAKHYADNDSMQKVLMARAKKLPDSPEKQSTLVYIRAIETANLIKSLSKAQREAKLREYLALHNKSEEYDFYERLGYLLDLCAYLNASTEGELLTNNLKELQTLIACLPDNDLALKYLFFKQAATSYLSNGMKTEGLEANKTVLKIIDDLAKQYAAMGRFSRKYDAVAYNCYKTLLKNYESLSTDEVEDYFNKINLLLDRNPDLIPLSGQRRKPTIFHMMANKRYAEAIPLIKKQLKDTMIVGDDQLYLAAALLKAAEKVGDKDDQILALEMSNQMLKTRIENKATESYNDLQTVYEVNDLKQANDELVLTNQQIMINRHKEQLTYTVICLVVLVILLIITIVLYRRSKQLTADLTKANTMLIDERDALQRTQKDLIEARDKVEIADRMKTDFVNNMGHEIRTPLESIVEYSGLIADCAEPREREAVQQFADVVTLNADILLTLVNDVLELPSLENAKVSVNLEKTSVQDICRDSIENVKRYIKPGTELIFANEDHDDLIILTDPERVEQVISNLLRNAAKFTTQGSITLKYRLSPNHDKVEFTVTDTGAGIPVDKKDAILSRSERHDKPAQTIGLGLYISRLIAEMLGGSLVLDNDYSEGTKFIFTIQIS